VGGAAAAFARQEMLGLGPFRTLAARLLALPGVRPVRVCSELFTPEPHRSAFEWLAGLGAGVPTCTAVGVSSGRPGSAAVLLRFPVGAARPDLVAKVGGKAAREAAVLQRLRAGAERAGVRVPRVISLTRYRDIDVLAREAVDGPLWSAELSRRPNRVAECAGAVADWLKAWHEITARPAVITAADIQALILGPAARVCAAYGYHQHLDRLQRLCARCTDTVVPFVAVHNDLTTANLVALDNQRLGVIDWEQGDDRGLPLGDLVYALVDAIAAADGYRDRPGAFTQCFALDLPPGSLVRKLLVDSAQSLRLSPAVAELCLQACWFTHADNELTRDGTPGPFAQIAGQIARGAPLLGHQ
jgi:hypothetical protein